MATSTTGFSVSSAQPVAQLQALRRNRRRSITAEAGRALEILSHSIEYLTDEAVHGCGSFSDLNGEFEAVQLLMELNRQIYFECPEFDTLGDRCREFLWKAHSLLRGNGQQN